MSLELIERERKRVVLEKTYAKPHTHRYTQLPLESAQSISHVKYQRASAQHERCEKKETVASAVRHMNVIPSNAMPSEYLV